MSVPSVAAGTTALYIGLMSGTSLDGVDGVLVDFSDQRPRVLAQTDVSFPAALREELLALNSPGSDEIARAWRAGNSLARVYAEVVDRLLKNGPDRAVVRAIGAHGQTVRHCPPSALGGAQRAADSAFTVQINNPSLLAELAGIDVVADFRSRDMAAGGEGAPLVPAFHREVFGSAERTVTVLNIGGIANVSVLCADGSVTGFDCGPGNLLLDHWCRLHTGQAFDAQGEWAASGRVQEALLAQLLAEPFLALPAPKSTGRDLFNSSWLAARLQPFASLAAKEVQATLTRFTAQACADAIASHAAEASEVLLCGGGALNTHLVSELSALLPGKQVSLTTTRGLAPLQVEAAAFAWLARQHVLGRPGNVAAVTGAKGPRVLGALYPR